MNHQPYAQCLEVQRTYSWVSNLPWLTLVARALYVGYSYSFGASCKYPGPPNPYTCTHSEPALYQPKSYKGLTCWLEPTFEFIATWVRLFGRQCSKEAPTRNCDSKVSPVIKSHGSSRGADPHLCLQLYFRTIPVGSYHTPLLVIS